jgi:hypothetical protein
MKQIIKTLLKINLPLFIVILFPAYYVTLFSAGLSGRSESSVEMIWITMSGAFSILMIFIAIESLIFAAYNKTKDINKPGVAKTWLITAGVATLGFVCFYLIRGI